MYPEAGDVVDLSQPDVVPALETDRPAAAYAVGEPSAEEQTPGRLVPCSASECDLSGSALHRTPDFERHRRPREERWCKRPCGRKVDPRESGNLQVVEPEVHQEGFVEPGGGARMAPVAPFRIQLAPDSRERRSSSRHAKETPAASPAL